MLSIPQALARIKGRLAESVPEALIRRACRAAGRAWRERTLAEGEWDGVDYAGRASGGETRTQLVYCLPRLPPGGVHAYKGRFLRCFCCNCNTDKDLARQAAAYNDR
jgi:hypothetical protein